MTMPRYAGIIAAGWGERLGQKIPKALTPVGGRALIDFTLDGLEAAGVTDGPQQSAVCSVPELRSAARGRGGVRIARRL